MSNDSDSSTTTTDDQKVVKIIELVSEAKELARTLTPTEGAAGALESKPYPGDTDSDSEVSP